MRLSRGAGIGAGPGARRSNFERRVAIWVASVIVAADLVFLACTPEPCLDEYSSACAAPYQPELGR